MSTATSAIRMTPQRQAVLDVVRRSHDHPTARDIYRRVRADLPGIGFATVYRTLALLSQHGEILELQLGDDAVSRYDGNIGPHDHVICTLCGAAADIVVELPAEAAVAAARESGFDVTGYALQFHGRCAACAQASRAPGH